MNEQPYKIYVTTEHNGKHYNTEVILERDMLAQATLVEGDKIQKVAIELLTKTIEDIVRDNIISVNNEQIKRYI